MNIEVSNGEILDKLTILKIKLEKIKNVEKLYHVKKEYEYLKKISKKINYLEEDFFNLLEINKKLWNIEDEIREFESKKIFNEYFIQLARSVYVTNDERAKIKKKINLYTNSNFLEVKSYKKYN